jgi:hypothetical protein
MRIDPPAAKRSRRTMIVFLFIDANTSTNIPPGNIDVILFLLVIFGARNVSSHTD